MSDGDERGARTVRSYAFLVNPLSGGGAAPGAVVPVARILREAGARVDVTYSPGPRESRGLVEDAVDRGDVVVAVGGDGMLSSIAGRVAALDGTLGIVPAGRGNDFARMLGLPTSPAAVADVLLQAPSAPIDLLGLHLDGREHVVAGSVYCGVDAVAGRIVDKARRLPRRAQYPYAAVHALATYRPLDLRLVIDGERYDYTAANVVVANSAYYGSGMRIAPSASVSDGLLDVVVIEAASRRALIRSLPKVYDGSHVRLPEVHVLRGTSVEFTGRPALDIGGDGEPLGRLPDAGRQPARVDVRAGALRVLLPAPPPAGR